MWEKAKNAVKRLKGYLNTHSRQRRKQCGHEFSLGYSILYSYSYSILYNHIPDKTHLAR